MNKFSIKSLIIAGAFTYVVGSVFSFLVSPGIKISMASELSAKEILPPVSKPSAEKKLVYIVSDTKIPFWSIMARGVKNGTDSLGYKLDIYSCDNSPKRELEFVAKAIKEKVSGIVISPTTSSACATILQITKTAGIPVVISDIGTDSGDYVSYISSDNREGAYQIGKVLSQAMAKRGWAHGKVGIIAIPQKRLNGQARTVGFVQAMKEAGIEGADIKQQSSFSYDETYQYSKELIEKNPDLRAIWLQGSNQYKGALDAIAKAGKKGQIVLVTFDAEPEFLELIPRGILVGSAMQQPYLMGQEAVYSMDKYLNGKPVKKNLKLPVLPVSVDNITQKMPIIKKNVLGIETPKKR